MPLVDLEFEAPLNVSCQIGDTAYYVNTSLAFTSNQTVSSGLSGGLAVNENITNPEYVGIIQHIENARSQPPYSTANPAPFITINTNLPATAFHNQPAYIFFSKDNKANLSSILGYYADIKFKNNSTEYAEIFSVGVDAFESSK